MLAHFPIRERLLPWVSLVIEDLESTPAPAHYSWVGRQASSEASCLLIAICLSAQQQGWVREWLVIYKWSSWA
jgi:hypothetical protein